MDDIKRMIELNRFLNEIKDPEINDVEDEELEDEELDEKTKNQLAHPRPVVGQYGKRKTVDKSTLRTNTVYGHTDSIADPNKQGHDPDYDVAKGGRRKGKLTKQSQKDMKAGIKQDKANREKKSSTEFTMKRQGSMETKPLKSKGKLPADRGDQAKKKENEKLKLQKQRKKLQKQREKLDK